MFEMALGDFLQKNNNQQQVKSGVVASQETHVAAVPSQDGNQQDDNQLVLATKIELQPVPKLVEHVHDHNYGGPFGADRRRHEAISALEKKLNINIGSDDATSTIKLANISTKALSVVATMAWQGVDVDKCIVILKSLAGEKIKLESPRVALKNDDDKKESQQISLLIEGLELAVHYSSIINPDVKKIAEILKNSLSMSLSNELGRIKEFEDKEDTQGHKQGLLFPRGEDFVANRFKAALMLKILQKETTTAGSADNIDTILRAIQGYFCSNKCRLFWNANDIAHCFTERNVSRNDLIKIIRLVNLPVVKAASVMALGLANHTIPAQTFTDGIDNSERQRIASLYRLFYKAVYLENGKSLGENYRTYLSIDSLDDENVLHRIKRGNRYTVELYGDEMARSFNARLCRGVLSSPLTLEFRSGMHAYYAPSLCIASYVNIACLIVGITFTFIMMSMSVLLLILVSVLANFLLNTLMLRCEYEGDVRMEAEKRLDEKLLEARKEIVDAKVEIRFDV